jgi:hypothetical protein
MVPADLSNVVMIAAGGYFSLALKADGTVAAWGDNTYGQTNTPAALSNVVAIAAGRYCSLALKSDGTMVGWGDKSYGQTNPPVGLANVVGMAGGGYHPLAMEGDGRPCLTVQPLSQNVSAGATVRLLALAVGLQPLSYQWQHNGTNLAGATANALTLAGVQCSDAGAYTLVISNQAGSSLSSAAVLTLSDTAPPTILSGPADQAVPVGQEAAFCVSATNDCGGQLAYQWRFQGIAIPGATTNCYALTAVQLTNSGSYDVVVANLAAAATSAVAILTVTGPCLTVCPGEWSATGSGRTNIMFVFPSVAGIDYVVQYKDVLTETNQWLPLATNSGTGGLITNDFPITTDPPGRFYRILIP